MGVSGIVAFCERFPGIYIEDKCNLLENVSYLLPIYIVVLSVYQVSTVPKYCYHSAFYDPCDQVQYLNKDRCLVQSHENIQSEDFASLAGLSCCDEVNGCPMV